MQSSVRPPALSLIHVSFDQSEREREREVDFPQAKIAFTISYALARRSSQDTRFNEKLTVVLAITANDSGNCRILRSINGGQDARKLSREGEGEGAEGTVAIIISLLPPPPPSRCPCYCRRYVARYKWSPANGN